MITNITVILISILLVIIYPHDVNSKISEDVKYATTRQIKLYFFMAFLRVYCWALIFTTSLRFPPRESLASIVRNNCTVQFSSVHVQHMYCAGSI